MKAEWRGSLRPRIRRGKIALDPRVGALSLNSWRPAIAGSNSRDSWGGGYFQSEGRPAAERDLSENKNGFQRQRLQGKDGTTANTTPKRPATTASTNILEK